MTGIGGSPSLQGSAIVVTGSTRGLGRAFAEALATAGAHVVVNGTTAKSTAAFVAEMSERGLAVNGLAGSVADDSFCQGLISHCVDTFGGIDMLINNAGITRDRSFTKMSVDEFDAVIDVHLRGTWSCSSAAARVMRSTGGGRILNITSGAGLFGMFGQANYAAAKAGVVGLTRVMDIELARFGIAVNALAPVAATDMTGVFDGQSGVEHALVFPPPDTVAPIAVYLASPESEAIHGQCLSFDGTELSVWSHPRALSSWTCESGWAPADFTQSLSGEGILDFPHPDRWGSGAAKK
ncbi:SDR family NAD(P)-dependent oxidoreductase [Gordonia polyisoprenivorans]|uniref:SDR family NAD(P)-dependent oxidoreductase n=1 Tax=Gordonia polyisoprenivorans TaxID=84595 RepID=UPI001AD608CB|nr:SDR family NAD(P)-dependent oxidoreductase [Gordonia polyisoprenivorans]QTI69019.1 SDR family NAD(P)-dependent oxidoreductase [Gordonia polyisoprenivorans]